MCNLLDTMSTETGERNAQAAHKTALETVIEDTEAELARLQRSKVASMIRLYQGELSALTWCSSTCLSAHRLPAIYLRGRSSTLYRIICLPSLGYPMSPHGCLALCSGMESPQHDSPKIGARHSPQPQKKLDNPLIPARNAPDSLSEVCCHPSTSWPTSMDTGRYGVGQPAEHV